MEEAQTSTFARPGAAPQGPTETIDVLVVGGGLAGYCAALEAAEAGASVVLCEREPEIGGATVHSGGSFAFAGTELQRKLGLEDGPECLFDDIRKVGDYKNEETLVRLYAQRQLDAYAWLGSMGVTFDKIFIGSGQSVPRAHSRDPHDVLNAVVRAAEKKGVKTWLSTRVRKLLRRDSDGPVNGVLIDTPTGSQRLNVTRGVVLATGGFSRNDHLLELFAPSQAKAQRMGSDGNQGDGLLMAWQLGASFRDMGYIKGTFGSHPSAGAHDHFILFPQYAGAIVVNIEARRFTNESRSYKLLGDACLTQPGALAFQIFDQKIFDAAQPGIPGMDFAAALAAGRIVSDPTLEGLARTLEIDPQRLVATVSDYNRDAALNRDEQFGRTSLCNGFGALVQIDRAPFYAYASTSVVLATYCGLTVDAQMRVVDVLGEVIPGLYAAGGVMGGFHGIAYMTGTANGKATIFGRIAGQMAAGHTSVS
jgi:fumarate reductase flavoprotein subunit